MPQTREHLAIMDLLGIEHGVVALTKVDLVDDAWLSLVRDEVARVISASSLREAPIVEVSSTTGGGLDALREALDAKLAKTSPRPDIGRARLPVDRSFAMAGFGTVVTGTLIGGTLVQGVEVEIYPSGVAARIRGLQQHNHAVETARPGTRTAVNLSGLDHSQVRRGDVLALPGTLPMTRRLDARLSVLASAAQPLRHRERLLMYHGTAEQMVEISLLERDELRPGEQGLAQLFAIDPIVALDGDRFVLRVASPPETVAGGVIIDVAPRRHRRRDELVLQSLEARAQADPSTTAVLELGKHPFGLSQRQLAQRLGVKPEQVDGLLSVPKEARAVRRLGSTWLTAEQWSAISARLLDVLRAYHQAQPLRRGMAREELRSRTAIPADLYASALTELAGEGRLNDHAGEIALAGHRQGLTPEQEASVGQFLADLELQPFNPPALTELVQRHHLAPALLQYLVAERRVVRLNDDTVFARSAYEEAVSRLKSHLSEHRTLTVAAARDVLGSSRRYVLPLLEWMDAQKITRRVGDDRILRD